jgi:hypothetical protein
MVTNAQSSPTVSRRCVRPDTVPCSRSGVGAAACTMRGAFTQSKDVLFLVTEQMLVLRDSHLELHHPCEPHAGMATCKSQHILVGLHCVGGACMRVWRNALQNDTEGVTSRGSEEQKSWKCLLMSASCGVCVVASSRRVQGRARARVQVEVCPTWDRSDLHGEGSASAETGVDLASGL